MSWSDVAFDANFVANVLGNLAGAPALHAGDVELGKSASRLVMIAAQKLPRLGRRKQHRFRLGNAERLDRGGPAKYSTRAVVEFRAPCRRAGPEHDDHRLRQLAASSSSKAVIVGQHLRRGGVYQCVEQPFWIAGVPTGDAPLIDQKGVICAGRITDASKHPGRVNSWVASLSRSG
jgi:hypothetical protein